MSKRNFAIVAALIVAILYGLTFSYAKDVMNGYIKPYGFILIRVFGAGVVFWLVSLFAPKQKIERQDYKYIFLCGFFGLTLNMLTFFKGLSMTTPIPAAVIMVTTPMLVLLLSALFFKEKIIKTKVLGIIIGLIGTVVLIGYGKQPTGGASNPVLGNALVFVNAASYAMYMILVKRLIDKYHALTFIKWMYLVSIVLTFPFAFNEVMEVSWEIMPTSIFLKVLYVIIGTTVLTYFLNLFAIKELKPTTASVFIYLQPFFATVFSLLLGTDELTNDKLIAALLIFIGVYLVSKPKKMMKA